MPLRIRNIKQLAAIIEFCSSNFKLAMDDSFWAHTICRVCAGRLSRYITSYVCEGEASGMMVWW
jgi:hypothetical protein